MEWFMGLIGSPNFISYLFPNFTIISQYFQIPNNPCVFFSEILSLSLWKASRGSWNHATFGGLGWILNALNKEVNESATKNMAQTKLHLLQLLLSRWFSFSRLVGYVSSLELSLQHISIYRNICESIKVMKYSIHVLHLITVREHFASWKIAVFSEIN